MAQIDPESLNYATPAHPERLRPILFAMVLAAIFSVTAAVVVAWRVN